MEDHKTRDHPEMEKYVYFQPVVMEDCPDAHNVFLRVGSQHFLITPHGCETKEMAEWHRDMICNALAQIIEESALGKADMKISKRVAAAVHKVLRNPKSSKAARTAAGRALTVRIKKTSRIRKLADHPE